MTISRLDASARVEVLERDILPALFGGSSSSSTPTLVLLGGAPGSGYQRATGRLLAALDDSATVLNGSELAAFHPAYLDLLTSRSSVDADELSSASAEWMRACIRYGRENRRSLILEGALRTAEVVAGAVGSFATQGYATHAVIVGARRSDAILDLVSRRLRDLRAGRPGDLLSVSQVDEAFQRLQDLANDLDGEIPVDRLTVLRPNGEVGYDSTDNVNVRATTSAGAALRDIDAQPRTTIESVSWLSELRRVTSFATSLRDPEREVTEALVALNEAAISEVIPGLVVDARSPRGSEVRRVQEMATAARLIVLRRSLAPAPPADQPGLVAAPTTPSTSGPSR